MSTEISEKWTVKAFQVGVQRSAKEYGGNVMSPPEGTPLYLEFTPEGGGWAQWTTTMPKYGHFETADEALRAARSCPGPWYFTPGEEMRPIRIVVMTTVERKEFMGASESPCYECGARPPDFAECRNFRGCPAGRGPVWQEI